MFHDLDKSMRPLFSSASRLRRREPLADSQAHRGKIPVTRKGRNSEMDTPITGKLVSRRQLLQATTTTPADKSPQQFVIRRVMSRKRRPYRSVKYFDE